MDTRLVQVNSHSGHLQHLRHIHILRYILSCWQKGSPPQAKTIQFFGETKPKLLSTYKIQRNGVIRDGRYHECVKGFYDHQTSQTRLDQTRPIAKVCIPTKNIWGTGVSPEGFHTVLEDGRRRSVSAYSDTLNVAISNRPMKESGINVRHSECNVLYDANGLQQFPTARR